MPSRPDAAVLRDLEGARPVIGSNSSAASLQHLDRVLSTFESYCTVTQSVRQGIPVAITVRDADGQVLTPAAA